MQTECYLILCSFMDSCFCFHIVSILYSNSEKGAHNRSNLCYSICSRHLIKSKAVTNQIFLPKKTNFSSCVRNMVWVTICYKYHGLKGWRNMDLLLMPRSGLMLHTGTRPDILYSWVQGPKGETMIYSDTFVFCFMKYTFWTGFIILNYNIL
mgnify:CR=1 FL=1